MRLILAITTALSIQGTALDLRPTQTIRELEGFKIPMLTFNDGQRVATWQPPEEWEYSYADERLKFSSPRIAGAAFELRILPRSPDEKPSTTEALTALAKSLFPQSFRDPVSTGSLPSPFMLGLIQTVEITFTGSEFARPAQGSVFFANLNDKQRLAILVTAREGDFKTVRDSVVSSLVGWNWAEAE